MEPLKGIRVFDFTHVVAGPGTTRVLAAFGAEVIKVEWPDPPAADTARNAHWNLDKLSITLNMKQPKAQELAKRLVAVSDIVVENYRPRVMRSMDLDYEQVRTIKPDIIMCSISGWGQDGPRQDWGSYGASSAAHTGLAYLVAQRDRPPTGLGVAYSDENPPWLAASAIMMALHYRRRTGKGMYIDMAQTQTAATFARQFYLDRSVNGRSARRPGFPDGNARPYPPAGPHNAFPCRGDDSWCAIAVTEDEQWEGLKEAMGCPEWAEDPKYDTGSGRFQHREELEAHLVQWTKKFDRFYLAGLLQDYGVPAGPVETSEDLAEFDVQLAHRGTFRIFHHPETGPSRFKIQTPILSKTPYQPKRSVPTVGQDNLYVFHELLHLSDTEIDMLAAEDVIRLPHISRAQGGK